MGILKCSYQREILRGIFTFKFKPNANFFQSLRFVYIVPLNDLNGEY